MNTFYTTQTGKWVLIISVVWLIVAAVMCDNRQERVLVSGVSFSSYTAAPCYWDNGMYRELDKVINGYAYAVHLANGDIYVTGYIRDTTGKDVPCYWKNGFRTDLPVSNSYTNGYANAICMTGADIYVAGYIESESGDKISCYWKNGVRVELANKDNKNAAYGIFVYNK